eukprot:2326294-Rhodomonas_salina.1
MREEERGGGEEEEMGRRGRRDVVDHDDGDGVCCEDEDEDDRFGFELFSSSRGGVITCTLLRPNVQSIAESALFPLEIYNDASARALGVLKQ